MAHLPVGHRVLLRVVIPPGGSGFPASGAKGGSPAFRKPPDPFATHESQNRHSSGERAALHARRTVRGRQLPCLNEPKTETLFYEPRYRDFRSQWISWPLS